MQASVSMCHLFPYHMPPACYSCYSPPYLPHGRQTSCAPSAAAAAADPESHPTLYAQAFMDVGSSVLWQSGQESDGAVDVRGTLQELGSSWRASAGVGLVLKMGAGNIEANICKVLRAARGDVASSYVLSLGLAVEGFE